MLSKLSWAEWGIVVTTFFLMVMIGCPFVSNYVHLAACDQALSKGRTVVSPSHHAKFIADIGGECYIEPGGRAVIVKRN